MFIIRRIRSGFHHFHDCFSSFGFVLNRRTIHLTSTCSPYPNGCWRTVSDQLLHVLCPGISVQMEIRKSITHSCVVQSMCRFAAHFYDLALTDIHVLARTPAHSPSSFYRLLFLFFVAARCADTLSADSVQLTE